MRRSKFIKLKVPFLNVSRLAHIPLKSGREVRGARREGPETGAPGTSEAFAEIVRRVEGVGRMPGPTSLAAQPSQSSMARK